MEKLSLILWRERELFTLLLYRLEVEQMMLASGRSQWWVRAAQEVEAVLQLLLETEVLRMAAVDESAAAIGLPSQPSLRALAGSVEEPWCEILRDHREAFVKMVAEMDGLSDIEQDLISAGFRAARTALSGLGGATDDDRPDRADGVWESMASTANVLRLVDRRG